MKYKRNSMKVRPVFFIAIALIVGFLLGNSGLITQKVESSGTGFNEFGYNYTARLFNGTGESWSLAKGLPANYLGAYAKDKLVMKWNAEWDRGNEQGWTNPPYQAWENNEWNGKVAGGSGAVWHYKIVWDQGCKENNTPTAGGNAYCIWGQFATMILTRAKARGF